MGKNSLLTLFPVLPATMLHAVGNLVTPRKKKKGKVFSKMKFQHCYQSASIICYQTPLIRSVLNAVTSE